MWGSFLRKGIQGYGDVGSLMKLDIFLHSVQYFSPKLLIHPQVWIGMTVGVTFRLHREVVLDSGT